MTKSDYNPGSFVVPKNGYKISQMTAAVVDCIRMFDAFYSRVSQSLDMLYGEDVAEERLNKTCFPQWSKLNDLLSEELKFSIEGNLMDLSNVQNEDEILL